MCESWPIGNSKLGGLDIALSDEILHANPNLYIMMQ